MLPFDDGILSQVADIGYTSLTSGLHEHPSKVSVEQAFVCVVWIQVRIGITMMGTVLSRPPFDRTLYGTGTCEGEDDFEGLGGVICAVAPKTMVAGSDT